MVYTLVDYAMMYWYLNFSGMPYSDKGVCHRSRLIIEKGDFHGGISYIRLLHSQSSKMLKVFEFLYFKLLIFIERFENC